ncbi:MAG: transporter substrate-binding domain-containing protein [Woeseiaceae bacterium]
MLACLLFAGACGPQDNEPGTDVPEDEGVLPTDVLPDSFARPLGPWKGDLDGMVERSVVRVFVPYGGYQFYYVRGRPRGAMVELMQRFERFLNDKVGRRHIRVNVFLMPVSRDRVLTGLTEGVADLAVGDLTVTADREERYAFTRPLLRDINEVVITGPSSPPLETLEDLSGKEVYVRRSSSYFEHLEQLSSALVEKGLAPIDIEPADELLEAEDILEMLAAGSISLTVFDDYKARFWADVFPKITVRDDLIVNEGGSIAWAHRPDSPELAAVLDEFLEEYGRGTLVGNDTFNRYLADAGSIRCQSSLSSLDKYADIIAAFKRYGERYDFDWLMLAAQGYQESRLRHDTRSSTGAVGIMQIKPATAADPNVGIPDIASPEDNIHAGAKYLRFLIDRYFIDDQDRLQRWLFGLAAYNAGPARVARLRNIAANEGYDPDRWFNNVEIIAARQIGAETVGYVSNVYKYYVGYKLFDTRMRRHADRHGPALTECDDLDQ